jgi:hypothetical protein
MTTEGTASTACTSVAAGPASSANAYASATARYGSRARAIVLTLAAPAGAAREGPAGHARPRAASAGYAARTAVRIRRPSPTYGRARAGRAATTFACRRRANGFAPAGGGVEGRSRAALVAYASLAAFLPAQHSAGRADALAVRVAYPSAATFGDTLPIADDLVGRALTLAGGRVEGSSPTALVAHAPIAALNLARCARTSAGHRVAYFSPGALGEALPTAEHFVGRAFALAGVGIKGLSSGACGAHAPISALHLAVCAGALAGHRVAYPPPGALSEALPVAEDFIGSALALAGVGIKGLSSGACGAHAPIAAELVARRARTVAAIWVAYLSPTALAEALPAAEDFVGRALALAGGSVEGTPAAALVVDTPIVAFRGAPGAHAPSIPPHLPRQRAALSSLCRRGSSTRWRN